MTSAAVLERTYTPEEIDSWEDAIAWELDDEGRLIERNMGFHSDEVAFEIAFRIRSHIKSHRLGRLVGAGTGLRIFPGRPRRMPRGDVVFISRERLRTSPKGLLEVAPDLVVEVVSPGDKAADVHAKAHEYLRGGVSMVWLAWPDERAVTVYRTGSVREFGPDDTITGDEVLPGFEARVADFFPDQDE